ncbi:MAG: ribosome biogenesis GTP-binding protein YihA/YsxC [Planctomycetes bacterium]|nr:ribosome biogenesis GTP-binding protein YihA/YsxC [Planctomycetota bacterium]MCC7396533.1 ribosome biogenesis GTP-binding protein YsxC [Planctomycetota bacterium]
MSRALSLQHVATTVAVQGLPPSRAEVAFLGRSNVGKSSLINALADHKGLAKVSKEPGRTKALFCYAAGERGATVVDCPGYGYAKVAKKLRAGWLPMLEDYLLRRQALRQVVLLVDGEIGPTDLDLAMLDWLREHEVPHTVVATKQDKVKPSHRERRRREFAAASGIEAHAVVWVSARDNEGLSRLRELVREWLG